MQVYADPITVNCRKVLAGLKLLGVDYTLSKVDYFKGEQKSDEFRRINPNAALPAMKDGDLVLWESNAILQYAADKHGKTEYYPTDPAKRADINRWLLWEAASWFPSCYIYLVENCVKPLLGGAPDQAVLDGEAANFHKLAGILDQRLSNSKWLCGDRPTIADIAVAAPMHLREWSKLPLESHPNLKGGSARVWSNFQPGRPLKLMRALGSPVLPDWLTRRDRESALVSWLPIDFRYAPFATAVMWRCKTM